jgi:uncharacterized membrane-anchored protein
MKVPSVRIPLLGRGKASEPPGIVAVARVDRKTKNISKRLHHGEIAIIDHADLDRVSAEELIRRKVAAVVNASVSMTGRYPNLGPQLLLDAGIPVVDGVGQDVMVKVTDGAVVRLDTETLYLGETVVAKGTPLTAEAVQEAMTVSPRYRVSVSSRTTEPSVTRTSTSGPAPSMTGMPASSSSCGPRFG